MAVVDELITLLGLKVDPKAEGEAQGFGKILGGVTQLAVAAGAALAATAGAVGAYAAKQAEAIDQSAKMADAFGLSFEAFQELEFAAQQSGAEVNEFRMDLENLAKRIADTDALAELGIQARDSTGQLKSTEEVIGDIAKKFEGLSNAEQNRLTDQLGLSPSALKLFQQGGDGIQRLRDEAISLGLVLDENAKKKAAAFQGSLLRTRSVVDALGKSISVGLLPSMTEALDGFSSWVIANRAFISSAVTQVVEGVAKGFDLLGSALSYVGGLIMDFIGPIDGMVDGLDATQAIAILVAGALAAVAVSVIAATWPFIAAGAAIAAVVLIIEDLYAALTGGDSIIGGWVESFTSSYPEIAGVFGSILAFLGAIASFVGDVLVSVFTNWGGAVLDTIGLVLGAFGDIIGAIEAIIGGANPFEVLGDLFMKQVDRILNIAKTLGSGILDTFGGIFGGSSAPASASSAPIPAGVIQSGASGTSNQNTTINVNGAGNPNAVAQEVVNRGGLGQTLQQSKPGMRGPMVG